MYLYLDTLHIFRNCANATEDWSQLVHERKDNQILITCSKIFPWKSINSNRPQLSRFIFIHHYVFNSSVGLLVVIQSAGELVYETSQRRILYSAEEDNLSPLDSKIAYLCQSIEINNNKHAYYQSQVQKRIGSEVKWAECSLVIGTGCWVQDFSLILNSSVGLWVGIPSAGELVSETSQLRILHSAEEDNLSPLDSKIACLCQSIGISNNKDVYRIKQHSCWGHYRNICDHSNTKSTLSKLQRYWQVIDKILKSVANFMIYW